MDFSKAFDRSCHQILLKKLRTFGIDGNLMKLLSSYLQNRRQRVIVNGGRDISSPTNYATKILAHFGDNDVAQMSRRLNGQICSHTPSALNAGAKRSGAKCHMAMPHRCYLAKRAKRPSHTTNILTSSNISGNDQFDQPIWSTPGLSRNSRDTRSRIEKCQFEMRIEK